jgi:hypothetical protein
MNRLILLSPKIIFTSYLKKGKLMKKVGLYIFWLSAIALVSLNCGNNSSPTGPDNDTKVGDFTISSTYTDTLPTALLKCLQTLGKSGPVDIHIKNGSKNAVAFLITVSIQDYTSSPGSATKTIAAGDTATISPSVFIDPSKLATLTTLTQSNYLVEVSTSNGVSTQSVYQNSHLVLLMARDAIPWIYQRQDMSVFSALWVTPTAQAIQSFLSTAKSYWGGNSWVGYQKASQSLDSISGVLVVPAANLDVWSNFPSGHGYISGSISSSSNVQLRFEDTSGNILPFCEKVPSATFENLPFSGPGNMVLSTSNLVMDANVTTSLKYQYFSGYVRQQAKAIYNALKAKGITYSSTTISFPSGSQKIRFPEDALSEESANCIDGTVLMASALEAIGIEPLIVLVPGHCFLGWRELSGNTVCEFLETTMIGTATFEDALNSGYKEYSDHLKSGDAKIVDVKAARALGLTPLRKRLN